LWLFFLLIAFFFSFLFLVHCLFTIPYLTPNSNSYCRVNNHWSYFREFYSSWIKVSTYPNHLTTINSKTLKIPSHHVQYHDYLIQVNYHFLFTLLNLFEICFNLLKCLTNFLPINFDIFLKIFVLWVSRVHFLNFQIWLSLCHHCLWSHHLFLFNHYHLSFVVVLYSIVLFLENWIYTYW